MAQAAALSFPVNRAEHLPVAGVLRPGVEREHVAEVVPGAAHQHRELPEWRRGRGGGPGASGEQIVEP